MRVSGKKQSAVYLVETIVESIKKHPSINIFGKYNTTITENWYICHYTVL